MQKCLLWECIYFEVNRNGEESQLVYILKVVHNIRKTRFQCTDFCFSHNIGEPPLVFQTSKLELNLIRYNCSAAHLFLFFVVDFPPLILLSGSKLHCDKLALIIDHQSGSGRFFDWVFQHSQNNHKHY